MTTNTISRTENNINVAEETSKFGLNVLMICAAMVGTWGVACLIGGLSSVGATNLVKGFLTATGM